MVNSQTSGRVTDKNYIETATLALDVSFEVESLSQTDASFQSFNLILSVLDLV